MTWNLLKEIRVANPFQNNCSNHTSFENIYNTVRDVYKPFGYTFTVWDSGPLETEGVSSEIFLSENDFQ